MLESLKKLPIEATLNTGFGFIALMALTMGGCASESPGEFAALSTEPAMILGDGVLDPDEECDDGNLIPGDGCDAEGRIEAGFTCNLDQRCGNGVIDYPEQCDDGNVIDRDGCSAECTEEVSLAGFVVEQHPEVIQAGSVLGDAIWDVSADGFSVTLPTTVNPQPSFFLSPNELFDEGPTVAFTTRFTNGADEDYLGFVFGALPGDLGNPGADYVLLAWKDEDQTVDFQGYPVDTACSGGEAQAGLELLRIQGAPGGDELWQRADCPGQGAIVTSLATSAAFSDVGYSVSGFPEVKVVYTATRIQVFLNEVLDIDVTGVFPTTGRFGFYTFAQQGVTYAPLEVPPIPISACVEICGDGLVVGRETCDDGNSMANDGCSASCEVEVGFSCDAAEPSVCGATCGDGIVTALEACDDGNTAAGDGCDDTPAGDCQVEVGFSCTGSPSVCTQTCGDGEVSSGEQCDDGGTADGDGCSAACLLEAGFVCSGQPSACATTCGDGVVAGSEGCDDGNTAVGDGCSDGCAIEPGFDCSGGPSVCAPIGQLIAPPPIPGEATVTERSMRFLYEGDDRVQLDVAEDVIQPDRAATIHGELLDIEGEPIDGARVSFNDRPEFGFTFTRSDGRFDMALNGGGMVRMRVTKAGYMTLERIITVPEHGQESLGVLIATRIEGGAPVDIDVGGFIPGVVEEDSEGPRRASIWVQSGTSAVMEQGGAMFPMDSDLTMGVTELTVGADGPARLPGELPLTSAYTYAAEYFVEEAAAVSADGVAFSKPVYSYVDNFLDFDVGEPVPVGRYDYSISAWVAEPNGIVMAIAAINNGVAELDLNENSGADPSLYGQFGVTLAEREQLAAEYNVGDELWRVGLTHFSPYDYNWSFGFPGDAEPPDGTVGTDDSSSPCTNEVDGSVIECENRVLRKHVDVPGTGMDLVYSSDRVRGAEQLRSLRFRETTPKSTSVVDEYRSVQVAGRFFFCENSECDDTLVWDGRDAFGRYVQGSSQADVSWTFRYQLVAGSSRGCGSSSFGRSSCSAGSVRGGRSGSEGFGAAAPGGSGPVSRGNFGYLSRRYQVFLGGYDASDVGLGGWTLSSHHFYDRVGRTLYLGDGTEQSVGGRIGSVTTAPGADGGLEDIQFSRDGQLYVLRRITAGQYELRVRDEDGTETAIAGGGTEAMPLRGESTDALATDLRFPSPEFAVCPNGDIMLSGGVTSGSSSPGRGLIFRVRDGAITLLGGSNNAVSSELFGRQFNPTGLACGNRGELYVADAAATNGGILVLEPTLDEVDPQVLLPARQVGDRDFTQISGLVLADDGALYFSALRSGLSRFQLFRLENDEFLALDGAPTSDRYEDLHLDGNRLLAVSDQGRVVWEWRIDEERPARRVIFGTGESVSSPLGPNDERFGKNAVPTRYVLNDPRHVAADGRGRILVADAWDGNRFALRRYDAPAATIDFSDDRSFIPSRDGRELYVFSSAGRHVETRDSLTGGVIRTFRYTSQGYLEAIVESDGQETTVERDGAGVATALISPTGERTALSINGGVRGNLESVTLAGSGGVPYAFTYDSANEGIVLSAQSPLGPTSTYTYSYGGLLSDDIAMNGGLIELDLTGDTSKGKTVRLTSPHGLITSHERVLGQFSDRALAGRGSRYMPDTRLTVTLPNKRVHTTTESQNADVLDVIASTGEVLQHIREKDPRFVAESFYPQTTTTTLPDGTAQVITESREVSVDSSGGVESFTQAVNVSRDTGGSDTFSTAFDAATNTYTTTSAEALVDTMQVREDGRPLVFSPAGFTATSYTYDPSGRLTVVTQGSGASARTWVFTYEPNSSDALGVSRLGRLASITSPENEVTTITSRDDAGRPLSVTLPDGSVLEARYDELGQLAAIVPPGRELHALDFDALGQMEAYVAPESCVGISSPDCIETSDDVLAMSYTLDREPASMTYPSDAGLAQQVRYTYDHWENPSTSLNRTVPSPDFTGNLLRIDDPVGARMFGYYDESASDTDAYRLRSVSDATADGSGSAGSLVYAWNGARLSSVSRIGTGSGSVGLGYDERFLLSEMQVAAFGTPAVAVPFTYDGDGVPTQAGSMSLTPSSQYRGIASMGLGSTTTVRTLNAFAELSGETTTFSGAARYSLDTSARDGMGRIATKTEVLNDGSGSTTLRTDFEYDLRGRVSEVYESSTAATRGALVREYTYDENGNRLSVLDGTGAVTESGVYDGQDRLIEYVRDGTTARYTYRDRGTLWTKSVGSDVTEYAYDVWGNLRSVDLPESLDPGAADIEYTIDGQNRRVGKWRNGELVQELLYQYQLNPVAVRDRANASSPWTTKRFVYASRANVPDFMVVNETDTYRLLVDQVGSVRMVVNVDTGAVAQVIDYDEFGRILSDSNPGFQPFGFSGGL
ncbi:MAG: DUF4215 domain-containing protein, partial [Myxococcota bacterium]